MNDMGKKLQFEDIKLIEATKDDLELIMGWRSNPLIYKYFYHQNAPLKWDEHITFWESRKNRIDWIINLRYNSHWRKIGSINISKLTDEKPEIGLFIGELTSWGSGYGKKAVKLALKYLKNTNYTGATASVSKENIGSQKLFEQLNFKRTSSIKLDKEWLYTIEFKK